ASILMAFQIVMLAINTLAADPFAVTTAVVRADGAGLNPLLRTVWNVIHPPIVFISYALVMIPFAVKLAGFTVSSEERNRDVIPVVDSIVRLNTVAAWVTTSAGIAIGGLWAYLVLGWGGYWGWDPVETSSLIPWLLLTGYYHAKATLRESDVLRDSFLVFSYIAVLFASWVTRSGILNTVHGFAITVVSWTMLVTLLSTFIPAAIVVLVAGYKGLEDDEDGRNRFFSFISLKDLSTKLALLGIMIITATSAAGVVVPAAINLQLAIFDFASLGDNMVSIGVDFFRTGFYFGSAFLLVSAFHCMKNSATSNRMKGFTILLLGLGGGVLGTLSVLDGNLALPTNYWPANVLIPLAIGAIGYLVVTFAKAMAGREPGLFTTRKLGRLMLHLGLMILLLGVFASENVVHETNYGYGPDDMHEIAPGITLQVTEVNLVSWSNPRDFELIVAIQVIEGDMIVGVGLANLIGHPSWGLMTHGVYVHSTALRDVFVAVIGFTTLAPDVYLATLNTRVLPLVSFVWLGVFLMVSAIVPMVVREMTLFRRAMKNKEQHIYEADQEATMESDPSPILDER
ncbi:MAG: cytochrome c biogenesis protein CcsA, partial [Candidatus Thorarchaeota archaeon]